MKILGIDSSGLVAATALMSDGIVTAEYQIHNLSLIHILLFIIHPAGSNGKTYLPAGRHIHEVKKSKGK